MKLNTWFTKVAETVSHAAGHAVAFIFCCLVILVWAACGPIFQFSGDGAAIQAKLDEFRDLGDFGGVVHLVFQF